MSSSEYFWDHEGLALWAYRAAQLDPHEPPEAVTLGESILGTGSVEIVPASRLRRDAQLVELDWTHLPGIWPRTARWYVWVRKKLADAVRARAIAHELAEWILMYVVRYQGEDIEQYADALADALLLPRHLIRSLLGAQLDLTLAEELCVTPARLALRWAEVMGESVAVLGPHGVECRGYGWPEDPYDLRRWAREDWIWIDGKLRRLWKTQLGRRETLLSW